MKKFSGTPFPEIDGQVETAIFPLRQCLGIINKWESGKCSEKKYFVTHINILFGKLPVCFHEHHIPTRS